MNKTGLLVVAVGLVALWFFLKPKTAAAALFNVGSRVALVTVISKTGTVIARRQLAGQTGWVYDVDWDAPASGVTLSLGEAFLVASTAPAPIPTSSSATGGTTTLLGLTCAAQPDGLLALLGR